MPIGCKKHISKSLISIFCLITFLCSACNPFDGNSSANKSFVKAPLARQTYTMPIVGIVDFDTLDPALAHDPSSISAIQMLYTGLVALDSNLHIKPQLASSWQVSNDGLTWTFHLKLHLTFNDGTPITSTDVAYSLDRALQPQTKSSVAPLYLADIKGADKLLAGRIDTLIGDGIQTPDPQTVVITTQHQNASFLSLLTSSCANIVEKSFVTKYADQFTEHLSEGGTSGPFQVAKYTHRVSLDLTPNKHYYNKPPQLQKVSLRIYHSEEQAYQDYQNKKLDTAPVPLSAYGNASTNKDFHRVPLLWTNYYSMNYLTPPFNNIHIRQAFALAIDKDAIVKNVWKGTVQATNHILPASLPGYNSNLTGPGSVQSTKGDSKKAQDLLKQGLQEEGWKSVDELPAITLTYATGIASFDEEVTALIHRWQTVLNVTVETDPVDENTLLDKVTAATNNAQGIQLWGLSWVGQSPEVPDPHSWLTQQFGKDAAYNSANYGQNTSKSAAQQQVVQQQLANADTTLPAGTSVKPDQLPARLKMYQEAEQQIVNDVAWIPMEQVTATFLRTSTIVGIKDNADGIVSPDDWAQIYRVQL